MVFQLRIHGSSGELLERKPSCPSWWVCGMYEDPDSLDCEAMILAAELYNYFVFLFPEHD